MKRLLIVDVPDGEQYELKTILLVSNMFRTILQHKEVTLPTDEEIEKDATKYVRHLKGGTISTDDDDMAFVAGIVQGQKDLINKILNQ